MGFLIIASVIGLVVILVASVVKDVFGLCNCFGQRVDLVFLMYVHPMVVGG